MFIQIFFHCLRLIFTLNLVFGYFNLSSSSSFINVYVVHTVSENVACLNCDKKAECCEVMHLQAADW